MANALIRAGAVVNARDRDGRTPLHWTQRSRSDGAYCRALIEAGADVDAADADGFTPLHLAVASDAPKCAEQLLEAGADVEAADAHGWTPLHSAARYGSAECVDQLLRFGADVGARTPSGATPLHLALYSIAVFNRPAHHIAAMLRTHAAADARWSGLRRAALTAWCR